MTNSRQTLGSSPRSIRLSMSACTTERAHPATAVFAGSGSLTALLLTVTRPEEIPAALAQGLAQRQPVLINIPAFQWRLSWLATLATILKWSGKFGWWLVDALAKFWLGFWLSAQLPNKDYVVPEWTKFNFVRQPDNKVILSPHEE
jgi:hypothetical protein